jgi:hypothetical protein
VQKIVRHIKISKTFGVEPKGINKEISDYFDKLFDGLNSHINEQQPNVIYYHKKIEDKDCMIMEEDIKHKIIYCSNINFWDFFIKFNFKYNEISEIVKSLLSLYLKRKIDSVMLKVINESDEWIKFN